MADRSFAAVRSRAALGPAFPLQPTIPLGTALDGIVVIGDREWDPAPLRRVRDHVSGIWQGRLSDDPHVSIFVVTFDRPVQIDPCTIAAALPLTRNGEWLASYLGGADGPRFAPSHASPRRLRLWWNGQAHSIILDALEAVSVLMLWDLPRITVHRSTMSRADGEMHTVSSRATEGVTEAPVPIRQQSVAAFEETDRALQALHERTKLGAIFRQALGSLLPARLIGDAGIGGKGDGATGGSKNEPGVLENLAGWVRWHTPLGKGLIAAFGNRMQLVEKLMQSGDIDGALKLALKLGNPDGKSGRKLFPNRLPGMRVSLDFNIGFGGVAMPILGDASFHALRSRYLQLADTLERQGDYRRAAYIRAQLLGDHQNAVLTLERGGLFADGARLALDAKLNPTLYIRLFYKAGEHDTALALARRNGCFDALAEDSRTSHPEFHAYVLKAWTDMLVATGQQLRALQVTDDVASRHDANAALIDARRMWLRDAFEASDEDARASELIVRALLTGPWAGRDFAAFPQLPRTGNTAADVALASTQALILHEGKRPGEDAIDFLSAMMRLINREAPEQNAFWAGPAPIVIENFVRASLELAPNGPIQRELGTLTHLLKQASLEVLAADLGKLRKIHAAPPTPTTDWTLPPPSATASPVVHACLLHNGTMLLSRQNDLMQLLDRHGTLLWQANVSEVEALVAVGSGPNVILVQGMSSQPNGVKRLTRFSTHSRRFHPIGTLDLVAYHDVTSEGQWLVQIGGQIGAIDLVKLCADMPVIEFLWSCALTPSVRVVSFFQDAHAPAWITRTLQPGREGLLEKWTLSQGKDLTAQILRPLASGRDQKIVPPSSWWWGQLYLPLDDLRSDAKLPFVAWSDRDEREIAKIMAVRCENDPTPDAFQSGDFNRARATIGSAVNGDGNVRTRLATAGQKPAHMTISHREDSSLICVARGTRIAPVARAGDQSGVVLLADQSGRVLRIDIAAGVVAAF
ncbi:hypothetical protein K9B35_01075 [Sphingomonas sp. R647]|uniref:tetratricopeptide repeat protein n=1 Tax=Sphingomonas sp. R647 TaxID=2875233 RepID=UPI001CD4AFD2|nr:hypothetical protein [Sphingomonas sp. R647]MCA1196550.1 hypothetical protein [Sphingomonas sp. R647]